MSYITTYTRNHFNPVHPEAEKIDIQDIAHALSLTCEGKWTCKFFLVCWGALYLLCEGGSWARVFQSSGAGLSFA